ncbi:hypothetical protein ACFY12_15575 [Streptomyces sp. NPDC001339]|uniref:hypothetical protein n=1 Tax=Streptomyces sp. NPDC001339 TaxID=3364563 RepID=UPI0036C98746
MSKITRTSHASHTARPPRPSRSHSRRISVRAAVATAILVGTLAIPTTTAMAAGPTGAHAVGKESKQKESKPEETVRRSDGLRTDVVRQTSCAGLIFADARERHRIRAHHKETHGAKAKKLHAGRRVTAVEQKPAAQIADDREERNGTHAVLITGGGGAAAAAVAGGSALAVAYCGSSQR